MEHRFNDLMVLPQTLTMGQNAGLNWIQPYDILSIMADMKMRHDNVHPKELLDS